MTQRALRFGIKNGTGQRASTWKLWTETAGGKSDVYLACRCLGGVLKASLHQSGQWHIAHSQRAFEESVKGAIPKFYDRYIEKWPRPPEFAPGVTLAFRIVTPWSAATITTEDADARSVTWLPAAPEPMAIEIDIFFTQPATRVTGWPGKNSMGTSLVGSFDLECRETVWVVHWLVPMPDLSSASGRGGHFYKDRSAGDLESDNLRALVFGTAPDGSRVIYDCAVERRAANNVESQPV